MATTTTTTTIARVELTYTTKNQSYILIIEKNHKYQTTIYVLNELSINTYTRNW